MKYLDERIKLTINNLPTHPDTLMVYYVNLPVIDELIFVGNCFVGKNENSKTFDITDFCRNYYNLNYDYSKEYLFDDNQWQVYIKYQDIDYLSNEEVVVPIYRYPNRKSVLETEISDNIDNLTNYTIHQVLQGVTKENEYGNLEGRFLPRVPFLSTDKVSFPIMSYQGDDVDWNLNAGVDKDFVLLKNGIGISSNNFTLKDWWKGDYVLTNDFDLYVSWENMMVDNQQTILESMPIFELANNYMVWTQTLRLKPTVFAYSYDEGQSEYGTIPITNYAGLESSQYYGYLSDDATYFDTYFWDNNSSQIGMNIYPAVNSNGKKKRVQYKFSVTDTSTDTNDIIEDIPNGTYRGSDWLMPSTNIDIEVKFYKSNGSTRYQTNIRSGETITVNDVEELVKMEVNIGGTIYLAELTNVLSENQLYEYTFIFVNEGDEGWSVSTKANSYRCSLFCQLYEETKITEAPEYIRFTRNASFGGAQKQIPIDMSSLPYEQEGDATLVNNFFNLSFEPTKYSGQYAAVYSKVGELLGFFNYNGISSLAKIITLNQPADMIGKIKMWLWFTDTANGVKDSSQIEFNFSEVPNLMPFIKEIVFYISRTTTNSQIKINNYVGYTDYNIRQVRLAKIDECPSRYYLQWRDRYMGMQMQPFAKTETYSENFSKSEIKNYSDVRKSSKVDITSKWKVNTGWVKEEDYPYYESIFCSPYIRLYDTNEDQVYDVLVTDSEYTEKTFNNQGGQLFNLQLNLELNQNQNILL